jgi:phage regulator Rha-like protein
MQEDSRPAQERSNRTPFSSFNVKYIQNWDDFRKTFRPIKLDFALNAATNE